MYFAKIHEPSQNPTWDTTNVIACERNILRARVVIEGVGGLCNVNYYTHV